MESETEVEPLRSNTDRYLHRFFAVILGVFLALIVTHLFTLEGEGVPRDWISFYTAARHLHSGDFSSIYNFDHYPKGFQFLYPPPMLLFYSPLGLLSSSQAWLAWSVTVWCAGLLALYILAEGLHFDRDRKISLALGVLSSGAWIYTVVVGQNSTIILLLLSLTIVLWVSKREFMAGIPLGLLLLKPTIGFPFLLVILCGRHIRVFLGSLCSAAFVGLLSFPLGSNLWGSYIIAMGNQAAKFDSKIESLWKHDTVLAFLRYFLHSTAPVLAYILWGVVVLFLGLIVALLWYSVRARAQIPRLFAVTVLAVVACSPYLFHYDTLILTIPVAIWASHATLYAKPNRAREIGYIVASLYLFELLGFFPSGDNGPSLIGPLVVVWLILEADDLWTIAGRFQEQRGET